MRTLFLSAQLPGHLDWGGYLRTAVEMTRRGHETLWASGAEVRRTVSESGVPFQEIKNTGWRWPPPPPLPADTEGSVEELRYLRQRRALDQWLDVERVAGATKEITVLVDEFRPDMIVSEMFVAAAGLAAEARNLPFVIAGWPAPSERETGRHPSTPTESIGRKEGEPDPMLAIARGRLQELCDRFGLSGHYWTSFGPPSLRSPLLHLSYWSPTWFGGRSRPPTQHVGGLAAEDAVPPPGDIPAPDASPWVLITLGTSFNRDPNFFVNAAHAAHRMGCLPLVVFGQDLAASWVQSTLPRLPKTALVRERVEFSEMLPYTRAAIHHGGAGTTHALVVHGIPQLVIPHAGDQSRQAQGVVQTGVGMSVPPRAATIETIVSALSALLPDLSEYRQRAVKLQSEFRKLGGIPAAADYLEAAQSGPAQPAAHRHAPSHTAPTEDNPCKR